MSDGIHISGPVGFMESSGGAVYFSKNAANTDAFAPNNKGTAPAIKKAQNNLGVAYWGEDNRFPQNIEQQMAYCGVGKEALSWKARALYGAGIIPGIIKDYIVENGVTTEVFEPIPKASNKDVYEFLNKRCMFRFWLEYFMDWCWFGNCFPEAIFDKAAKKITHFVQQESCDSRFKQQEENGEINTVYLSKIWGMGTDQFAKFDPEKAILGVIRNLNIPYEVDGKFIKAVDCIDMYNHLQSAQTIAAKLQNKSANALKSAILPVNYPSPNKTYYQVPAWDGARLGGWVEIACKIPAIIKLFLKKGTRLQYHIEVPETYFEKKFGREIWQSKSTLLQTEAKRDLMKSMDEFLTSDKAPFATFVSFFDVDPREKTEFGKMKISQIENKYGVDKDLVTSSAADLQILAAMGVHPTLFGAGSIGGTQQRTGGSDIREAFLIYNAQLNLERQVALEPLYLARDFNGWNPEIQFRIIDTKLTTLDQNKGTTKIVS